MAADSATHCPAARLEHTSHQGLPSGPAMAATLSMAAACAWRCRRRGNSSSPRAAWREARGPGTAAGGGRPHHQRLAGGGATFLSQRHLRTRARLAQPGPAWSSPAHFPPVARGTRTIVSAESPPVVSCSERAELDRRGATRCLSPRSSGASRDSIGGWRRGWV